MGQGDKTTAYKNLT